MKVGDSPTLSAYTAHYLEQHGQTPELLETIKTSGEQILLDGYRGVGDPSRTVDAGWTVVENIEDLTSTLEQLRDHARRRHEGNKGAIERYQPASLEGVQREPVQDGDTKSGGDLGSRWHDANHNPRADLRIYQQTARELGEERVHTRRFQYSDAPVGEPMNILIGALKEFRNEYAVVAATPGAVICNVNNEAAEELHAKGQSSSAGSSAAHGSSHGILGSGSSWSASSSHASQSTSSVDYQRTTADTRIVRPLMELRDRIRSLRLMPARHYDIKASRQESSVWKAIGLAEFEPRATLPMPGFAHPSLRRQTRRQNERIEADNKLAREAYDEFGSQLDQEWRVPIQEHTRVVDSLELTPAYITPPLPYVSDDRY
jgi:hypothetical protein